MAEYVPEEIEQRWQAWWEEQRTFRTGTDRSRPKYYVLDMFPYPSGAGLHVGHPEGYTATDIVARYKRMRGFNVLHPMGWDAFGLPAERAAMRTGEHPARLTRQYIDNFRRQIKRLGFSYDWEREINTTDPKYYRWTQWIFLQLYRKGLAYRAEVPVNWCPALGTVLANEEVKDGVYVETGDPVERRMMTQWQLRISVYAQRLLDDLDLLDWPESLKSMQRNWIGRSEGAEVRFEVPGSPTPIAVFTTRPDTLFGATYLVLAPEHDLVAEVTTAEQRDAVDAYVEAASRRSERDRTADVRDKTGVFTGGFAKHPVTGADVPVWISDYVLASYGTGAIMAVPGHDERDWDFATKFGLPIVEVVTGGDVETAAWCGEGVATNSDFLDGLETEAAKRAMIAWLETNERGTGQVTYKLRDWLFSRQRYWGEPFPLALADDGRVVPLPESELPVELPHIEAYRPTDEGEPPLARATEWLRWTDPETGETLRRETNTMPQWAGSCWYYLRYIDPLNEEAFVDPEAEKYWMPVDLYVGGAEHAVLHLLYARFWHKVLYDAGFVSTPEPFRRLFNQGMILAFSYRDAQGRYWHPSDIDPETKDSAAPRLKDGTPVTTQIEKMSKSKLNVVNPDEVIAEYGADAFRLYEMYMGPLDASKPWQTDGVRGMYRFLVRTWRLLGGDDENGRGPKLVDRPVDGDMARLLHATTKRVTEELEGLRFNTAIAALIELVNALQKQAELPRGGAERLVLLLSPFAPHLAEELWRSLGHTTSTSEAEWPVWDESLLVQDEMTLPVQINGKVRDTVVVPATLDEASIFEAALGLPKVQAALESGSLVKRIYVPGRIVNLIIR